jgi:sugar lactone lactonase YvrE
MSMFSVVSRNVFKFASLLSLDNLSTLLAASCLLVVPSAVWAQAPTAHFSGAVATIGSGFNSPYGVAVDRAGNVFVADFNNNAVEEIVAVNGAVSSSSTVNTIGSGFGGPGGVAVDGAGNVFVADEENNAVKEIVAVSGAVSSSSTVNAVGSGFSGPSGVAVDGAGNVFVADEGNNAVKEIVAVNGSVSSSSTVNTVGSGFSYPYGIAVDSVGNVFVADTANSAVKEIVAVNGSVSPGSTVNTVGSGFSYPYGVAVDSVGNVFVADTMNSAVKEIAAVNGSVSSSSTVNMVGSGGYSFPGGVAADSAGNVFVGDTYNNAVEKIMTQGVNFGDLPVATGTPVILSLGFTFDTGGTIGVPAALTQGASGLDFTDAGTGTCTTTNGPDNTYDPGDSCTVDVTFTPKYPGTRFGAVVLNDASGNALATGYVSGLGVAPLATFSPATASVAIVGSAFENPTGMALDAAGNVYVADTWHYRLVKETLSAGTYTASTIFLGTGRVYGVGIDGVGNVYTADCTAFKIFKLPWNGSSYGTKVDIADWASTGVVWCPTDIVADAQGNLFVTDYYQTYIYEIPFSAGVYGAPIHIGSGMNKPYAVAVDSDHNLFVADWGNNRVVEEPWTGAGYGAQIVLASGMGGPDGLALDDRGNIYVANYSNSTVKVFPKAGNGFGAMTTLSAFGNYVNGPEGLALDGSGNIFLMNYTNGNVVKLAVSGPPTLTFATPTTLGTVDAIDGAKSATVENIGNADLIFTASGLTAPTDFLQTGGSGSPVDCAASGTVSAGEACNLSIDFHPTAAGTFTESFVLANNSLNNSPATQSIGLLGTGAALGDTTATAVSVSPSTVYAGQTMTITATVADSTNGSTTPTGSVTLTDTVGSTTTTLNGGAAVSLVSGIAALSSVTLSGVGTHTITANYAGVVGSFASSSNTGSISVTAPPTATMTPPAALNMGQVPVGQAGSAQTLTFTIATTGVLGSSAQVFALGAGGKGQPFVLTSGSCNPETLTQIFASGSSCTEQVYFSPNYPGVQYGAVEILDQSSHVLATAYIYAIGTGPEAATLPGTPASVPATGSFLSTYALAFDGYGRLYFADFSGNQVYRVGQDGGAATLIAGNGTQGGSGDNALATNAELSNPSDVAIDGAGNVYIADYGNNRVRMVSAATGKITAYAGTGATGWTGDNGQATSATLNGPTGLALDGAGNLYIAEQYNHVIRKVTAAAGIITTVAGNGTQGFSGDTGLATQAQLNRPYGVAVDGAGNLYIADKNNNRVRMVSANSGDISTVAGNGTASASDSGDGGPATQAVINNPLAVAVDAAGNLAIVDSTAAIRMVFAASGIIETDSVSVGVPVALREDGAGNLYAADTFSGGLYIVSPTTSFTYPTATAVGSMDTADGAMTALFLNTGNTALTAVAPGLTAPAGFFHVAGSGTPADCTATFSMAAGAACTLNLEFEPAAPGSLTESYSITDNSLNQSSTTQTIGLKGTALPVQATLTVTGVPNTAQSYGTTFTVGSSGGSGSGAVTFNASGVCSVSGTTVTITAGSGTCSVTASKATDGTYAAATSAAASVAASLATEATLTVTGAPNAAQPYGTTFTIGSSGGSGSGAVMFNASGACSVSGTTVTITAGSGTCSVTATKASDENYAAATSAAASVAASLATEATLTATGVPNTAQPYGTTFTIGSSGGSGSGSVTFNASGACSVSGTTVTMTAGSGTCSVTATKASDGNYAAATSAAASVAASLATEAALTISGVPDTAQPYGTTFTVSSSGGSGSGAVTFNATGACSVSITTVTITAGSGSCSVTALKASDGTYAAATSAAASVAASLATEATLTVTGFPNTAQLYGTTFTVGSSGGSGNGAVTFNASGACSVSGTTVTISAGSGTCLVTVTKASDGHYAAATSTAATASAVLASQIITFAPLASPVDYTSPIALSATGGSSTKPIVFSIVSGPGAISGNTLILTSGGTVMVAANQDGDANYTRAAQVTQSVVSVASNLVFNIAGLAFGSVPLGTTSPAQTLIISNPNEFAATGTSISPSGDFGAASNCATIAPLSTCSVNITFTPSVAGTRTGNVTVTDAQTSAQLSATLTGNGTAPGIQFSTPALNFGSVVNTASSYGQTITIQNTGTADLAISNIATTGDFATSGNCATIPAGSNCSLTVIFTPSATGARSGTVTLTDNVGGSNQSQVVNLSGIGTQAGATLTPSVETFPSTLVSSTGFPVNATLTNTGTAPLTGIGVSIQGDFTETNTCQSSLAPAATCIVSVTYVPTIAGAESGTLTVATSLGARTVSLVGTGVVPGASLSSSQLMFGGQLINTVSLAQTVVFVNTGTTAIKIGSVATTNHFTNTTNCSGSIAAGGSCSVNVVFTPTTAGPLSGTVTINDGAGTQTVSLAGQGVSPGLAVSPSFEIFGAQVAGTTSQAQTLTVTNTGTVALTLNPIAVSNNFIESDQCPATLQPGATCSVSLSFEPTSTGTLSGSVVISDASGLASTLATASGQGTLPGIAASPSMLSFGSLAVGTTSQGQTVTVTNTGTAPLKIGTVSGTGDFTETDTCSSQTVAPNAYCVISVTMTPTTVGTRTGTIQFNDSVDGLHQIALSGVGQQAGVSVSPTSLAFGSAPIVSSALAPSTAGTSLSVTLSNSGSAPLALGAFATQGDFSESDNCGSAVAVGATCTLTVKFVPTALGHRTGTLTSTDNADGGSQTVSLAGDGSPAGLILTPPVIDFGVQPKSVTSKVHIATLSNNTGQAITDLLILASGEYSEADSCGTALANGASCTLNITVTPATAGAVTGTVVISGGGVFATAAPSVKTRGESASNAAASSISNVGVVATLADTNGNANATVSELAFGSTPTAVIAAGGNAGSSITVLENDSNGNVVGATDIITLTVTGPGGFSKAYTATASGGIATYNLGSNVLTAAGAYSYTVTVAANALIKAATASEAIIAGAAASVTATAGSGQSAATNVAFGAPLQVGVKDSYGNPVSGVTVTFAAPAAGAGAALSSNSVKTGGTGAADVTATANGTAGTYTVTAAASGATLASFSLTNSQIQSNVDFSLNPGSVNGEGPSQTVYPGGAATYALAIVPTPGTTLPGSTTLTITGMPADATASIVTSPWTQLAGNSWSFPANTSFTGFALTIQLPSAMALLDQKDAPMRKIPPVLWGILLLPFAGRMRRIGKRLGKTASILMLMVVGLTAGMALSGCGSQNGFFGQPQKTYNVTVTATSGTLSHSTNLTLTVE